jgi:hypothetical protein
MARANLQHGLPARGEREVMQLLEALVVVGGCDGKLLVV